MAKVCLKALLEDVTSCSLREKVPEFVSGATLASKIRLWCFYFCLEIIRKDDSLNTKYSLKVSYGTHKCLLNWFTELVQTLESSFRQLAARDSKPLKGLSAFLRDCRRRCLETDPWKDTSWWSSGWRRCLAIMNNSAMNIYVKVFLWTYAEPSMAPGTWPDWGSQGDEEKTGFSNREAGWEHRVFVVSSWAGRWGYGTQINK